MLTFSCARVALANMVSTRSAAHIAGAATLSIAILATIWSAAYADGMALGGCVGGTGALNCVVRWGEAGDAYIRVVPQPTGATSGPRRRNATASGKSAAGRPSRRIATACRGTNMPRRAASSASSNNGR